MSLTSVLEYGHELRAKLAKEFPKPKLSSIPAMKAPPLTKNYSLVGSAFDYLLRFRIQLLNRKRIVVTQEWVSDLAYLALKRRLHKYTDYPLIEMDGKRTNLADYIERSSWDAKANHAKYLNDGTITDELLKSVLFLAKLDLMFG